MKQRLLFLSLFSLLLLFYSCQKEVSSENGGSPSEGSLQSDVSGDCLPKNVGGIYEAGTVLGATHFIEVQVNVTKTGAYIITSDTLNGVSFRSTGIFTTTGLTIVRLNAKGTPVSGGVNTYDIIYGGTFCSIAVTTLPAGGAVPAVFTLAGAPTTCLSFDLAGTYTTGVALTGPANNVILDVNVTTPGTYTITTTTSNGITFAGTGSLPAAGPATITLIASGTPTATGTANLSVTAGTSTCSFPVVVTGPAVFTVNCPASVIRGTYTQGIAVGAIHSIDLEVNVTAIGSYSITATVNGITFTNTGTFTTATLQTITLFGEAHQQMPATSMYQLLSGPTPVMYHLLYYRAHRLRIMSITHVLLQVTGVMNLMTIRMIHFSAQL